MKIAGIVAEYNPLHRGHLFHIHETRRLLKADGIICVMSGNFTQRGEPAIIDKWARAEMAIRAGADLVFEIPVIFAVRSAYHFARGAITLLDMTGVTTHLSFGSEQGELVPLQELAAILHQEPPVLRTYLKHYLDAGHSYPAARARALAAYFEHLSIQKPYSVIDILAQPNNLLAIEYLRFLKDIDSSMIPVTITRKGAGYYEPGNIEYPSASYIRSRLYEHTPVDELTGLPSFTRDIIRREFENGRGPVAQKHLADIILYLLRRLPLEDLAAVDDIAEGLEHRLKKAAETSSNLEQLISSVKTRRYNRTRINRILFYLLTGITREKSTRLTEHGPAYLRLLGFSPQGRKILQNMKMKSRLPIITKLGRIEGNRYPDPIMREMLELDVMATDIYALFTGQPAGEDYIRAPFHL